MVTGPYGRKLLPNINYGKGYNCFDGFVASGFKDLPYMISVPRNFYETAHAREVRCSAYFGCKIDYCNVDGYNTQWAGTVARSETYLICYTVRHRTYLDSPRLPRGYCHYAPDSSPSNYDGDTSYNYMILAPNQCNAESERYDYAPRSYRL